jgi:hypothetical protein
VRGREQFAQVPGYIGTDASEGFAALATRRQVKADQPCGDGQDEFVVVRMSETDMRRGIGIWRGHEGDMTERRKG